MTWWDHETESIWSQPVGRALAGALKGTELALLPVQVTTWGNWKADHPDSLAMINNLERLASGRQGFRPNFVLGLLVSGEAKAYYYTDVIASGLGILGVSAPDKM